MPLAAELAAHLLRLKVWAGVSLLWGLVLLLGDWRSGFGGMTVGWAVINLLIAFAASRGAPPTDTDGFRRFLAFNLGLNLVWIAIGIAMTRNRGNPWVASAGGAMIVQGGVLMALDLLLYARTGR